MVFSTPLSVYPKIMFVLCAVASPPHTTQKDFSFFDRFYELMGALYPFQLLGAEGLPGEIC
jgi:hypothetical protein